MFLGGNQNISVGGSEAFTLNRDALATLAGTLGDGYYGIKEFWREVLCTFQAAQVFSEVEKIQNGTFDTDINGWAGAYGSWNAGTISVETGGDGGDYAYYLFDTVVGVTYNVSADLVALGAGAQGHISTQEPGEDSRLGPKLGSQSSMSTGSLGFSFVATTTQTKLILATEVEASTSVWDNISAIGAEPVSFGSTGPRKTLRFVESDIHNISFSSTAPTGVYELKNVIIIDRDHGQFVIEKADIPNQLFYNLTVS